MMASKKMWPLITTSAARLAMAYSMGFASAVAAGIHFFPHTFGLDKYKEIVQMYSDGESTSLDLDVKSVAEEVLKQTNLDDREKKLVSFFTVWGFDVFHAGSTQLGDAIVGLPINFTYKSSSGVDIMQLGIRGKDEFSWSSPNGKQLIDSLVYSLAAKKFAIAREIYYANTNYVFFNGFSTMNCILISYLTGRMINDRLGLFARPRKQRIYVYTILSILGVILWIMTKDLISIYYDGYCDRKAAELGEEYVLGGVEYYEKLLLRNKSLRSAMGKSGEKLYTAGGNVRELVRVSQIPIDSRLDFMKNQLKQAQIS